MKTMIEKLKELDFTEAEANAYIVLLNESPLTGYAVSQKTKIDRSQIYIVLEGLINKGCVVASKNQKIYYIPISFNIFLERYTRLKEKERTQALELISSLKNKDDTLEVVNSVYRIQDIYEQLNRLIEEAKVSITLRIWNVDMPFFEEALKMAHNKGLNLVVGVYGDYHHDLIPAYSVDLMEWKQERTNYRFIKADIDTNTIFCACISDVFQTYAAWTTNKMMHEIVKKSLSYDMKLCESYVSYPSDIKAKWVDFMLFSRRKYS